MKRVVIIGIFGVLLVGSGLADSFTGTVTTVIDGDTVVVEMSRGADMKPSTINHQPFCKVRLAGIDAPEKEQAHGVQSGKALSKKIFGETVTVEYATKDRYGRIIGTVYLNSRLRTEASPRHGRNINHELVKEGFAWVYRRYSDIAELIELERRARKKEIGLWKNPAAIAPWNFRKIPK